MAERFSGKYSPAAAPEGGSRALPPAPVPRMRLMFILPYLFLAGAYFNSSPAQLFLGLGTFGALTAAAFLTREGMRAHAAYDARRVARRPALPRKLLGAVLMAGGLALGALSSGLGPRFAILFAITGAVLHVFAFGWDPFRGKGTEGLDQFQTDRVARAVDEGEAYIAAMRDAILRLRDRGLELRVETFAETAQGLFRSIEDDPGDLSAARKYLSVYLMGARDATVKFVNHYAQTRDQTARAEYEALLRDLETTFAARSRTLLGNGKTGLDIEIDVLRERLKLES